MLKRLLFTVSEPTPTALAMSSRKSRPNTDIWPRTVSQGARNARLSGARIQLHACCARPFQRVVRPRLVSRVHLVGSLTKELRKKAKRFGRHSVWNHLKHLV